MDTLEQEVYKLNQRVFDLTVVNNQQKEQLKDANDTIIELRKATLQHERDILSLTNKVIYYEEVNKASMISKQLLYDENAKYKKEYNKCQSLILFLKQGLETIVCSGLFSRKSLAKKLLGSI